MKQNKRAQSGNCLLEALVFIIMIGLFIAFLSNTDKRKNTWNSYTFQVNTNLVPNTYRFLDSSGWTDGKEYPTCEAVTKAARECYLNYHPSEKWVSATNISLKDGSFQCK